MPDVPPFTADESSATIYETVLTPAPPCEHSSLAHMLRWRSRTTPNRDAFSYRLDGGWKTDSWSTFAQYVEQVAAGFVELGLGVQECVALASATRYEWLVTDFAVLSSGAVNTTIYPISTDADIAHILTNSQARIVVAENMALAEPVLRLGSQLPDVHTIVLIENLRSDGVPSESTPPAEASLASEQSPTIITLDELARRGAECLLRDPAIIDRRVAQITPTSVASILYTSGTTGRPKGVVATHGSWLSTLEALVQLDHYDEDDVQLLWLPLAHAFGKLLGICGVRAGLLTAVDGNVDRISANLVEVRPTFMCAVPRVLEKVYARVRTQGDANPVKRRLLNWATAVAIPTDEPSQGSKMRIPWRQGVADALVLRKIRAALGGRLRFVISGSAPLDPRIARWFTAIGVPVLEGYGLTESWAASTINRMGEITWGTVGSPLPGTQVRIADDGEVLLRGPGIMREYYRDEEATASTLTSDGWLRTEDIGSLDHHGNLRITDRKKAVFKTANGKYVAPGAIEARFAALCPYAAQLIVIGESRRYVTALVALDPEALTEWARERGMRFQDFSELTKSPDVTTMVQGYLDTMNAELNPWERVQKFLLLPRELTIAGGDLTPSMKLRRAVVERSFATEIDSQYETGGTDTAASGERLGRV